MPNQVFSILFLMLLSWGMNHMANAAEQPVSWSANPELKGRTMKDFPNDVQVVVHEGHPRISGVTPEYMWVTITKYANGVYSGKLINKPEKLARHRLGQEIDFIVPSNPKLPAVEVTVDLLAEMRHWTVTKCDKCGNDQVLESPLDFIRKKFPDLPKDSVMESYTYFCYLCGGVMVIEKKK